MNENSLPDETLPLAAKQRIDKLCMAFEDAWIAGQNPRAEAYLEDFSQAGRAVLLRELLRLELHYQRERGEPVDPQQYRDRFPGYSQVVGEVLGNAVTSPVAAWGDGRGPDTDRKLDAETSRHGRFLPGTLLANRYRVVGRLGQGGMGEVYRADDLKLGQALALKFLPQGLADDAEVQTLFRNEVRLARQVAHPNVCRVYDMVEAAGQQFLSMEYVDGENLASLRRRIGRLPADRGLVIARQLVAGLAAAHERGILHRDLKPANVMLDGRGHVRITDFGLACLSETAADEQMLAGTPFYMAPEQLAGEPVTVRSDLYSIGLVLYEVFTGQEAFQAISVEELVRVRQEQSHLAPSQLVDGLDPSVDQVILQLLESDPHDRPSSALAVLAALPGGDPLQTAVAAGETPSPEMVAAARQPGQLSAAAGWLCLAGIVAALFVVAALSDSTTLVGQAALKSPQALTEHARRIITDQGYDQPPADWACGFRYESDRSQITPLSFWYRQSPTALVPQLFSGSIVARGDGTVSLHDPPPPIPGEVSVRLGPRGRLLELRAAPDSYAHEAPAFTRREPHPQPTTASQDERGTSAPANADSSVPSTRKSAAYASVRISLFIVLMVAAGLLARFNLRRGRGDRKGAFRLACFLLIVGTLSCLLLSGRAANPPSWTAFMMGMQITVFWALVLWLFYMALEPWVRRLWPETLVSWTRVLAGRFRDPLVGRDLLIGAVFGVVTKLLSQVGILVPSWLGFEPVSLLGPQRTYVGISLRPLLGSRYGVGELIHYLGTAVTDGIIILLLLLLLRLVLRKKLPAGGAYVLYGAVAFSIDVGHPHFSWIVAGLGSALLVWLVMRFGLLALISWAYVRLVLSFPLTADLSAWHAGGTTLLPLGVVVALAGYGLHMALAGRPGIRNVSWRAAGVSRPERKQ